MSGGARRVAEPIGEGDFDSMNGESVKLIQFEGVSLLVCGVYALLFLDVVYTTFTRQNR